ncbi:hypothetical protein PAECIP111891_02464 [Paenibacillus allorhizoplanae]|uniref:Sporulation histidine kinase inhibitor Sda n=1 Tax=Paenibacillus allorhizoplanae TaxID=2905648 RepID=A0ABM9C7B2_9BACL|nr:hypothetical protein PAECIP111891_02464 [Paenibacillus allorhizoplanae]
MNAIEVFLITRELTAMDEMTKLDEVLHNDIERERNC